MQYQKPIFKKKEVVIELPNENNSVSLGSTGGLKTAEVLYVGEQQENYKVGDTILYKWHSTFDDITSNYIIDYPPLSKKLLRLDENLFVICKLE